MIDAEKILDYFDHIGKPFDRNILKEKDYSILAGGSVVNALLSIIDNKPYSINDFDVFIEDRKYNKMVTDKEMPLPNEIIIDEDNLPPEDDDYPVILTQRVFMVNREEKGDVDYIYMRLHNTFLINNSTNFYKLVLDSFDLNCTEAGIYYDHEKLGFVLLTTPDFDKFLQDRQVRVTNIHSDVTFARMLKKTNDLGAYCNVEQEAIIVNTACNYNSMKPMTKAQTEKHIAYLDEYNRMKPILYAGIEEPKDKGVIPLNKRPLENVYDCFGIIFGSSPGYIRPLKVALARFIVEKKNGRKNQLLQVLNSFNRESVVLPYLLENYNGTLEEWIGNRSLSKARIKQALGLLETHRRLTGFVKGKTLEEIIDTIDLINQRIQKEFPELDKDYCYGVFESINMPKSTDLDEVFNLVIRQIKSQLENDSKILFDSKYRLPTRTINEIKITELVSSMDLIVEGSRQHHCVGGYSSAVKSGRSRILTMYDIKNDLRYTVELKKKSNGNGIYFAIGQLSSACNMGAPRYIYDAIRYYTEEINVFPDKYLFDESFVELIEEEFIPF